MQQTNCFDKLAHAGTGILGIRAFFTHDFHFDEHSYILDMI